MTHDPNSKAHSRDHVRIREHAKPPAHLEVHQIEEAPGNFQLTPDDLAFLETLQFQSAYQLTHSPKTSPTIATAYTDGVLGAIRGNTMLGGAPAADKATALLQTQAKLTSIAEKLSPVLRLVAQNLVVTDGQLSVILGDALAAAHRQAKAHPALAEQLKPAADWAKSQHPGHGAAPATAAATPTK